MNQLDAAAILAAPELLKALVELEDQAAMCVDSRIEFLKALNNANALIKRITESAE